MKPESGEYLGNHTLESPSRSCKQWIPWMSLRHYLVLSCDLCPWDQLAVPLRLLHLEAEDPRLKEERKIVAKARPAAGSPCRSCPASPPACHRSPDPRATTRRQPLRSLLSPGGETFDAKRLAELAVKEITLLRAMMPIRREA